jgi:outer membrane protein assembly factor BamB
MNAIKRPFVVLSSLLLISGTDAENWSQFRGPNSQGCSSQTGVPLTWTASENIAWKTPLPGEGWSSPIVWEDSVFVTTATDGGETCRMVALARKTGKILWDVEVLKQKLSRKEGRNTYATPTPATNGERVYACFHDGSFAALDFSGKVVWTNRSYPFYSQHGLGSSPIIHGDLLIMARDGSNEGEEKGLGWQRPWDRGFVVALDTRTGKERWKTGRGSSRISHGVPSIYTPPNGKAQLVSEAGDVVQGFEVLTGERLWSSEVIGEGKVPSAVLGGDLVFTSGGWGGRESIKAFRIGMKGDCGTNNLVWERKGIMPKVPSMLHVEGLLFAITDSGSLSCLEARTGETIWKDRLAGSFSASPIAAEGRIYFVADNGETTVIAAAREFRVLAKNPIEEKVQASLAVAPGQILIRGERHLFAIGRKVE